MRLEKLFGFLRGIGGALNGQVVHQLDVEPQVLKSNAPDLIDIPLEPGHAAFFSWPMDTILCIQPFEF